MHVRRSPKLSVGAQWALPVLEISGLASRHDAGEGTQIIAVADEGQLATATLTGGDRQSQAAARAQDVAAQGTSSDFEGVACDRTRAFLLHEKDACVFVFDAGNYERATHVIRLSITADTARSTLGPGAAWFQDDSKRGEGLLLLRNGHILMAKQCDPVCLIEFGPPGAKAGGYWSDAALPADEDFAITCDDVTMDILAAWNVDLASGVESINDLAVDEQGRLHAVSSRSRCLARLDDPLSPDAHSMAFTVWPLPADLFKDRRDRDTEDRAEGLTFTPELGCLVALDHKRTAPNVFQIDGVP